MKKVICGLLFAFMSITCFSKHMPIMIDFYDLNNSIYLGDAATDQGLNPALNNLLSKSMISFRDWSETFSGSFYDYVKLVEKNQVKDKVLSEKSAKDERVKKIRSFVEDHDEKFSGVLRLRFAELNKSALAQNYAEVGKKPEIIFDSFFNNFDFYKANSIDYHIVFRSFGKDIDTAVRITENRLGVKFRKAKFFGKALYLFAEDKPVSYSDKRLLDLADSKTSSQKVNEILADLKHEGIIEKEIVDFHEIQKVLTETKYLAVQDHHAAWASNEDWFNGKMFFFPETNSLGQEILPTFRDDNIEGAESDKGIVHPIRYDKNVKSWISVHPRSLLDSQLFSVNTEDAMMDKNYFINNSITALRKYHYRKGQVMPKLILAQEQSEEKK